MTKELRNRLLNIKNQIDSGVDYDTQAEVVNLHLWLGEIVDGLLTEDNSIGLQAVPTDDAVDDSVPGPQAPPRPKNHFPVA